MTRLRLLEISRVGEMTHSWVFSFGKLICKGFADRKRRRSLKAINRLIKQKRGVRKNHKYNRLGEG
jgi:hypothetical protein